MTNPAAGLRLKALLERSRIPGETNEELARRLGVTKQGLHRWTSGNEPTMGGFLAIARVTGMPRYRCVGIWDGQEC